MAQQRVVSGARIKVFLSKGPGTPAQLVGTFSRAGYRVAIDQQGAWLLGRFTAGTIDTTAQELCDINATGWRVAGLDPHAVYGIPKVSELLTADYLSFVFFDRATGKVIGGVEQCRPTGYSQEFAAKQLSEMPVSYVGILPADEGDTSPEEDATATPQL